MIDKDMEAATVKFARALDEKVLPLMPKGKHASITAQRNFLGIFAERQAKLQKQIEWLKEKQEYYEKLKAENP